MGNTYAEVSAAHVGCPISNKVVLTPGFNRLSSRINASSFQLGLRLTPKKRLPLFSNKVFLPCHCLNIRNSDFLIPHKLSVSSSTRYIFNLALKVLRPKIARLHWIFSANIDISSCQHFSLCHYANSVCKTLVRFFPLCLFISNFNCSTSLHCKHCRHWHSIVSTLQSVSLCKQCVQNIS